MKKTVILSHLEIKVPMTPNFLIRRSGFDQHGSYTIPIEFFSDAQLKKIGKVFIENLIESANKKRKRK